jgi:hypothetical protein
MGVEGRHQVYTRIKQKKYGGTMTTVQDLARAFNDEILAEALKAADENAYVPPYLQPQKPSPPDWFSQRGYYALRFDRLS